MRIVFLAVLGLCLTSAHARGNKCDFYFKKGQDYFERGADSYNEGLPVWNDIRNALANTDFDVETICEDIIVAHDSFKESFASFRISSKFSEEAAKVCNGNNVSRARGNFQRSEENKEVANEKKERLEKLMDAFKCSQGQ